MPLRPEPEIVELLRELTLVPGPPGFEAGVRRVALDALEGVAGLEISHDQLGSLIIEKSGSAATPRVAVDAHLDEIGFMVETLRADGMLSFLPLGGWWPHVMLAQRVEVLTEGGVVPGVFGSKPPHFLSPGDGDRVMKHEEIFIDVGAASREEAEGFGIQVGDFVVPRSEFMPLANPRILSSKAFDDRAGVGIMLEALLALRDEVHPNTVIGVGAVQEEVGIRGAFTAAAASKPDVGIVLEGPPADDTPGIANSPRQGVLGKGPQVRLYDPTAIANRALTKLVQRVAEENGIPFQLAVRRSGGTDARAIHMHEAGVPTVVIGVPARYVHTHVTLIHLDDYLASLRLVVELIKVLDAEALQSFAPQP
jgi:endoglucanase